MERNNIVKRMLYACFSVLLTWLGFAACADEEEEERWLEYGTPHATHEIKGKVVDPENESKPVAGIQVIVRGLEGSNYRPDTFFTDKSGEFTTLQPGFKLYEDYRIYYEEVVQEGVTPVYKKDSIDVKTDTVLEKGEGWYGGKSSVEVLIKLKKKEIEEEEE